MMFTVNAQLYSLNPFIELWNTVWLVTVLPKSLNHTFHYIIISSLLILAQLDWDFFYRVFVHRIYCFYRWLVCTEKSGWPCVSDFAGGLVRVVLLSYKVFVTPNIQTQYIEKESELSYHSNRPLLVLAYWLEINRINNRLIVTQHTNLLLLLSKHTKFI